MSELNLHASQPAITNWLSSAMETLIELETKRRSLQGSPASVHVLDEYRIETADTSTIAENA